MFLLGVIMSRYALLEIKCGLSRGKTTFLYFVCAFVILHKSKCFFFYTFTPPPFFLININIRLILDKTKITKKVEFNNRNPTLVLCSKNF